MVKEWGWTLIPTIKINTPDGNKILKEAALKAVKEQYAKKGLEVTCPKCHAKLVVRPNHTTCKNCGSNIILEFE